jgi:hypothetical protein
MKKILTGIPLVLLVLIAGCQQQETPVASAVPCEFEEGENFCVSEAGDVYYDLSNVAPEKSSGVTAISVCVDGIDSGFCTDENGKVSSPKDKLPRDVCGNGTFRAPCDPKEVGA